ncbi:Gar1/Naf1 RNA binding region-domain-containing protein [Sporodiniella umbellata]|nr:Gar1/Naf1 RNA binding region-domain-containing protein [Sporodiniella umbellata]
MDPPVDDLLIASQFAEQELAQNLLREGQNRPQETVEPDRGLAEEDKRLEAAIAGESKGEAGDESSEFELSSDSEDSGDENQPEEEEETAKEEGPLKTKNEVTEFTIEKPVFDLTQTTEILFAGNVFQVIDHVIVIQARNGAEYNALDAGSLLVSESREVVGEVFETFGPIARPFYTVRYNDRNEINPALAVVGTPIFYAPSYQKTQVIQTERLKLIKHTDASNFFDEEVAEDEAEFSDDEKELAHRQQKNREKKM